MSNIVIVDQDIREQALNPQQSFIVQAPAGSGKTELLIQRYLVLLAQAKTPEEIIAITFTRKAAAEMRERILQALQLAQHQSMPEITHQAKTWKLAKNALDREKEKAWDLQQNPNRMRILTIDALAASISSQMPILSKLGAQPQIIENAQSLYALAAQRLLTDLSQSSGYQKAANQLLQHLDNRVYSLELLFTRILANREQWLPHIIGYQNNPAELKQHLEQGLMHIAIEAMQSVKQHLSDEVMAELIPLANFAANYLTTEDPNHPITNCLNLESLPDIKADNFSVWLGLTHLLLTQKGQWRKSVTKRCGFPASNPLATPTENKRNKLYKSQMQTLLASLRENHPGLETALAKLQQCPPLQYEKNQWQILEALLTLLPILVAHLKIIFQQQQSVDFIELSLAASHALGDEEHPTDLAMRLDYQIQHLLVDEFQDTSITQFNLLEKLTANWQADEEKSIFLVGDPMQSIYRFRHAEVGLFLRAREEGIANISLTPLILKNNFRSKAAVIHWFNHSFSEIFPSEIDIVAGAVPYTKAAPVEENKTGTVLCHPLIDSDKQEEAEFIIKIIQQQQRKYPTHNTAILVRSRNQLAHIIPALHQANLSFQALDIEPLSDRMEIQDLFTLTRALLHRADRIAWLALLRAPWCGLLLKDMQIIAQADNTKTIWQSLSNFVSLEKLSSDAKQRLKRIIPILHHCLKQYARLPLSEWIEGTWISLGGPACLNSQTELTHCQAYFKLLTSLEEKHSNISIELIKTQLQTLYAEPDPQANPNLQIMTIHKAKGLEFDHVILPDLARKTPADTLQLLMWLERPSLLSGSDLILAPIKASINDRDPIYDYLRRVEKQKLDLETARLLYVAATRAKQSLHLIAPVETDEGSPEELLSPNKGSFLHLLWPIYKDFLQQAAAKSISKSNQSINTTESAEMEEITEQNPPLIRLNNQWSIPPLNTNQNTQNPFLKIEHIKNLKLPDQTARLTGIVIHEILKKIAKEGLDLWNIKKIDLEKNQWKNRLKQLNLNNKELDNSLSLINQAIKNTLNNARARWILSPHKQAESEWEVTTVINNQIKHYIIDRTFIDEKGIRWIIDFKNTTQDIDLPAYQKQLEDYAHALQNLSNHPIKLGLYFPLSTKWYEWSMNEVIMNPL